MTTLNADTVTIEQIKSLKDEAGTAGDLDMVEICQDALYCDGERQRSARQRIARVINETQAQAD